MKIVKKSNSKVFSVLSKYRYVRHFQSGTSRLKEKTVKKLLYQAWKVTPSKNNFMPYKVHVLGPKHQEYKDSIFQKCLQNEGDSDGVIDPLTDRYLEQLPNYANILTCDYLLIFTLRVEHYPNPFQQMLIERGHNYPATKENEIETLVTPASLEVGMFANTFKTLCLEKDIDVAFTGCFPYDITHWRDIPFVKREPLLLMTIGKGKVFRQDHASEVEKTDYKPDYKKVINFVG